MVNIESVVEKCCRELLAMPQPNEVLDMSRHLVEGYGLSSLQFVTLVTTICEETGLPLTVLTERDIAGMKTAKDIADVVRRALQTEQRT